MNAEERMRRGTKGEGKKRAEEGEGGGQGAWEKEVGLEKGKSAVVLLP